MDAPVQVRSGASAVRASRPGWAEITFAATAFAVLCIAVLSVAPQLVEPDDYAYRGSIVAMTQGHFLTLSAAQFHALSVRLARSSGPRPQVRAVGQAGGRPGVRVVGPAGGPPGVAQWIRLPDGRWISEKDPGYPFLAAPFQLLGVIRLAPLFYGALGCLGLFFGARRWLGRLGGAAAVGLFCTSGAALLFAWRDYMPTFTEAGLIAAGTGALLWTLLATEASARRRTWTGLLGFVAIEAAVFSRYSNVAVLGCAVLAVLALRLRRPEILPRRALWWWLGSAVLFAAGVAVFNDLVYGGPLRSGYRPGEIRFGLGSVLPNLRYMPGHLIQAMPMLVLGLAGLAWIGARWLRLAPRHGRPRSARRDTAGRRDPADARRDPADARRDAAVGLALAASWFSVWGLYAAYSWTAGPGLSTLQAARFYVPVIGAIALLGAWLLTHLPLRASMTALTSAAVVAAMAGLGIWSFTNTGQFRLGPPHILHGPPGKPPPGGKRPPGAAGAPAAGGPYNRSAGPSGQPG